MKEVRDLFEKRIHAEPAREVGLLLAAVAADRTKVVDVLNLVLAIQSLHREGPAESQCPRSVGP